MFLIFLQDFYLPYSCFETLKIKNNICGIIAFSIFVLKKERKEGKKEGGERVSEYPYPCIKTQMSSRANITMNQFKMYL